MASINQNAYSSALPNFRNLGILLRILLLANLMAFGVAVSRSSTLPDVWDNFIDISAFAQPFFVVSVLTLMGLSDVLRRMPYVVGGGVVLAVELIIVLLLHRIGLTALGPQIGSLETQLLLVIPGTLVLLAYFDLRGRALSPALGEARLQALQARIRPHFLYNSINAVLSLIRQDPRRAETALHDMADLFRVLMADNRELQPLRDEVELCRRYLELEELRLGPRLQVEWNIDKMPGDALIPPLVLQPLLENAVYHGIEPRIEPGVIRIDIYAAKDRLHAVLRNPYSRDGNHHGGNKMALSNIRERLALHFDAEAQLETRVGDDSYQVHIALPYVKAHS